MLTSSDFRFDWYSASLPVGPRDFVEAFGSLYGGEVVKAKGRPLKGFTSSEMFVDMGTQKRVVDVQSGGKDFPKGTCHVITSGESTPVVVDFIRGHFPDHRVSRLDACADYLGDFDAYRSKLEGLALQLRVKARLEGDYLRGEDGRTVYFGSTKSKSMVRLYEKGVQLAREHRLPEEQAPSREYLRLETQARPEKPLQKATAARLAPFEVFGVSRFSREAAALLVDSKPEPVLASSWSKSPHEEALRSLLRQYGRRLWDHLGLMGSPEAVGVDLFKRLKAMEHPGSPFLPVPASAEQWSALGASMAAEDSGSSS